jgi:hypothetical protein
MQTTQDPPPTKRSRVWRGYQYLDNTLAYCV